MPDKQREKDPGAARQTEVEPQPHHVADEPVDEADAIDAGVKSPTTETGLPVAEQIRKEWDPNKDGGLPTPLHSPPLRQTRR